MIKTDIILKLAALCYSQLPKCTKVIGNTTYTQHIDENSPEYYDFMILIKDLEYTKDDIIDAAIDNSYLF